MRLFQEAISLSTPRGRLVILAALFICLLGLGPDRLEGGPTLCLISKIIGRPCPACGMTRAGASLARFKLKRAAHYNWLIFPVALTLAFNIYQDLGQILKQYL